LIKKRDITLLFALANKSDVLICIIMGVKVVEKKYKNVFWFLIDGLRPDFLHLDGDPKKQNFIDKCLMKGTVFNNVVTNGGGTYTSMHSIFSSLLPSYNKMTGVVKEAFRNFDQEIFTIPDYFQLAGYETFRYDDADGPDCPISGFKRWESSGYYIWRTLEHTDLTKTERRDRFIEDVNICATNKFVYHHLGLLHDINGKMGTFWSSEGYAKNVEVTAKEFEKLYNEYSVSEDDLVIISADHGVLLDMNFIDDCRKYVGRHYEQSVVSFFALIGKEIPPQVLSNPISALDEAPTLLRIALGDYMPGQGKDQYDYIYKNEHQKSVYFRENIVFWCFPELANYLASDLYYLRDGEWKYVMAEQYPQCEWLINLEKDGDYQINRKDQYPELREKYHQQVRNILDGSKNFQYKSPFGFNKADVKPEFSLILQMDQIEVNTIESILYMSGPYYEVLMPSCDTAKRYKGHCKVRIMDVLDGISISKYSRGEWLVYLTENGEYSEYFLSDLYRYIQHHRKENVKIIGEHYTAVRKQEADNFTGVELYEVKQVRVCRFLYSKPAKKYILFGCGGMGREIREYLGPNAFCFVDNDPAKVGKKIDGTPVISFDKLLEIHSNYHIVITSRLYVDEIKAQLEEAGIHNYFLVKERFEENHVTCWENEFTLIGPDKQNFN